MNFAALEQTITSAMQQAQVPGLAVALVEGDRVRLAQVIGVTRSARTPLTHASLFQAASLSKPLFAAGVLGLCARGLLDLDTPIARYYTDPAARDPQASAITARHVLSHTTGLPNWREESDQTNLAPAWPPGTRFGYSGEGFEYLQRAIEHIAGQPLAELMHGTLLAPLGMIHSRFGWGLDQHGNELLDVDGIAAPGAARTIASAAWSLLTTAEDYARLLLAMLNPSANGPISAESIAAMLTPHRQVGRHTTLRWGLGWGLQQTARGACFWHWGGPQNNYTSYTATLAEQRIGIVILANGPDGHAACRAIAEQALGVSQPAFDWIVPAERWQPRG